MMKFILALLLIFQLAASKSTQTHKHMYIVHVHQDVANLPTSVVHRYEHVFTGFAAKMTRAEVRALEGEAWFISARRERSYSLQTTHSPAFLGLAANLGVWQRSSYGKGVVIGVLDSGITPYHPSFGDDGIPPPPSKWKGACEFHDTTACNKKLIGARFFQMDDNQLDMVGHGTHTSSIATGNFISGASVYGNANGMASGVAPLAHLAIYKVCKLKCAESAIIAGMEAAIRDGVDIISMSLIGDSLPFYMDSVAIAALRCIEKGILVSVAAGNSGPAFGTISRGAPWYLAVGASTIDREISVLVHLGNGEVLRGQSAFRPHNISRLNTMPVTYGKGNGKYCIRGSLEDSIGKVVVCEAGNLTRSLQGMAVQYAGGAAMILMNTEQQGYVTPADVDVLATADISFADSLKLKAYLDSTPSPTVSLSFEGTRIGNVSAPVVASFSARGPSLHSPGILKPDVIGPGVSILAAWPFSVDNSNSSSASFNIISGTSMACPHLSGVAALVKSLHPEWSPAAIKSAILTTADHLNHNGNPIEDERSAPANIFAIGAGHVNPLKASDPGLVYDIHFDEYVPYLCGLNYTNDQVGKIVQRKIDCEESKIPEQQLNYPTFSIKLVGPTPQTYTRTLTNVGEPGTYDLEISLPAGVDVDVQPRTLTFSKLSEKHNYSVKFSLSARKVVGSPISAGYIIWKSPKYSVRSAIAVHLGSYNGCERSDSNWLRLMRYSLIALGFMIARP